MLQLHHSIYTSLGQDMAFDDNDYLYNPAVIEPGYAVILKKGSNTDNVGIHKFVEYCSTL